MGRFYARIARPLLKGRDRSKIFLVAVGLATLAACALFATKDVRVKLLPFDNKSEIQVVVDLPQGASLEETDRVLMAAAERLRDLPELDVDPGLCRDGGAVQLQRSRAPLLSAREPDRAISRSISSPRASARGRATRSRSISASGSPICRCPPARRSRWSRCRPGRRCSRRCSPRSTGRTRRAGARWPRRCARPSKRSISSSTSTTVSAPVRAPALRDRPGGARVPRRRGAGGLRHDRRHDRRREGRLFAARRAASSRSRSASALPQAARCRSNERILSTPLPAGGTARQGANVELGDVVRLKRERASYPIFRHNGRFAEMVSGRGRRALRGADLRHARGRGRDRQDGLGRGRTAAKSRITASRSTTSSRPCCGTANGRSPM